MTATDILLAPARGLALYRYEVRLELTSPLVLPENAGAVVRGAFDASLRYAFKTVGQHSVYARLFEPSPSPEARRALLLSGTPPKPVVIEPPLSAQRAFVPGESLAVGLVLVGSANAYLPALVEALDVLGTRSGMGGRRYEGEGRFRVAAVTDRHGTYLHDGRWRGAREAPPLDLADPDPPADRLDLSFLTPARVRTAQRASGRAQRGLFKPQDAAGLWVLAEHLRRRLAQLATLYGPGPLGPYTPLDQEPGFHLAPVSAFEVRLRWHDWERFSTRQQANMLLGGFVGHLSASGPAATQLAPLFRLGADAHLGAATTFGNGRFRLETGLRSAPSVQDQGAEVRTASGQRLDHHELGVRAIAPASPCRTMAPGGYPPQTS